MWFDHISLIHTYYRMQFIIIKRFIIIYIVLIIPRYTYSMACIHMYTSCPHKPTCNTIYYIIYVCTYKIWALCANVRIVFAPKRFPRAGTSALKRECEKSVWESKTHNTRVSPIVGGGLEDLSRCSRRRRRSVDTSLTCEIPI